MCAEMMDVTRDEAKRILRRLGELNLLQSFYCLNSSYNINSDVKIVNLVDHQINVISH